MQCNMVETDSPFQDVEVAMMPSLSLSPLPLAFRHTLEAEERSQLLAELVEAITGHVHEVSTFLYQVPPPSHSLPPPLTLSPSAGCEA